MDNTVKLRDTAEFKGYASDPIALYKKAQDMKLSVTGYLESLDPTPVDPETGLRACPLDAFERQLAAAGLVLTGQNQMKVADLAASDNVYLMPELVLREIQAGMAMSSRYDARDCIAMSVPTKGATYHPLYIPDLNLDAGEARNTKSLGRRAAKGKGGAFPVSSIYTREKDIALQDYGRTIEAAYSVIRDYPWEEFAMFLRLIGAQIAVDELQDIYDLGIHGDGTVGAATDTFAGVAGTIAYSDLITNVTSFSAPYRMDRILAPQGACEDILSLPQFSDPLAFPGKVFQSTGEFVDAMGAKMKQVDATPGATPTATVIVTLSSKHAVREVVGQPLSVEADKIINRKMEECVVSMEKAFSIVCDGALKRIVYT
jgi:hypothetical protein